MTWLSVLLLSTSFVTPSRCTTQHVMHQVYGEVTCWLNWGCFEPTQYLCSCALHGLLFPDKEKPRVEKRQCYHFGHCSFHKNSNTTAADRNLTFWPFLTSTS